MGMATDRIMRWPRLGARLDSARMQLDRQQRPEQLDASGRPLVPQRVPETRPTPLQDWFIYLSVIVLICGVIAISALEFGATLHDALVRWPLIGGGLVLIVVTADAIVRVWRSARAWWPVSRDRGLFRLLWLAVLLAILVAAAGLVAAELFAA
jgi:hypothetical protein